VRVGPLETIDRSSRLVLVSAGILSIAGVAATLLTSIGRPSADLSTPLGVVTTYVQAIQAGDADRAWALTAETTVQPAPAEPPRPFLSKDDFRQQVQSSRQSTTPRVRVLSTSQSGDTASVQLEVSHASGDPLTGVSTQLLTVALTRQGGSWRITSDPYPGQVQ
jgi:ketosteroid isomerase-like protein